MTGGGQIARSPDWDLWVDFQRVDAEGLTHARVQDTSPGVQVRARSFLVVGDTDADPAVAEVVDVMRDGIVLLRVLPGHADADLHLVPRV